jgi:hypothetical protein
VKKLACQKSQRVKQTRFICAVKLFCVAQKKLLKKIVLRERKRDIIFILILYKDSA